MPKNDDGEFELILGNRQLLGVFFIVIVLLAVFFTMGYIVGRNSTPLITADTPTRKSDVKPLVVDSPAPKEVPPSIPSAEPTPQQPETPAPVVKPEVKPEVKAPVKKETPPEKEKPAPKKKEEPAKPEPRRTDKSPLTGMPEQGKTYLQLVATAKADADAMVDLLRKNGFKALNYQVPEKPSLYRVLVGPIPDGEVNKTRADLQAKSFPGDHAVAKKSF